MLNKKLLLGTFMAGTIAAVFSANTNAAVDGPYIGLQGGYMNIASNAAHGAMGRASLGYQCNEDWAIEGGYSQFRLTIATAAVQYTIDAVIKGMLPISDSSNAYMKIGAAYLHTTQIGTTNQVSPEGSIGFSYDLTPNLPIDISANRIQGIGSQNIKNLNFFMIGLAYNFGG